MTQPAGTEALGDHSHRCREGHTWYHTGPTAATCRIREYRMADRERYISPEDCPLCSDRGDLLARPVHRHYCPTCEGPWTHEGRCAEAHRAQCPWCFPGTDRPRVPGLRDGVHRHLCSQCLQTWQHEQPCAEPLRGALLECPSCHGAGPGTAVEWMGEVPSVSARRSAGRRKRRRTRGAVAAAVLISGAVLGVMLSRFVGPAPRGSPPVSTRVPSVTPIPPGTQPSASPDAPAGVASSPEAPAVPAEPKAPSPPATASLPSRAGPDAMATAVGPEGSEGSPARPPGPSAQSVREPEPAKTAAVQPREPRPQPFAGPCVKPSRPTPVIGLESGTMLGRWIDVEIGAGDKPGRCLFVIQRAADTRWVIDATHVQVAPR